MSLWARIREKLGGGASDGQVAESRDVGGVPQEGVSDLHSTTGTTPNEKFVGRVAGTDTGYEGLTGAEARDAAGEDEDTKKSP
ncbi:hypothetical protein [Kribbella deserti]|uniref:Uncharacterized protein n=1 Tax=Kribbella deserti TaxID=1926257 RepID=A0ABV6QR93_9ACTN